MCSSDLERLSEDHDHAQKIGAALLKKDFIGQILPIETNMIIFEVKGKYTAQTLADVFKNNNILCIPISSTHIRMVTHLDVTNEMTENIKLE